jgi:hypothetical protein
MFLEWRFDPTARHVVAHISESVSSYLVVDFWSVLTDRARLEGSGGGGADPSFVAELS